jgi:hypothetical protein
MDEISKQQVCFHFDTFNNEKDGALFIGLQPFDLKVVDNKFNIEI